MSTGHLVPLNFDISTDENGIPMVYECYPDAFKSIYQGKSCSVYVVDRFIRFDVDLQNCLKQDIRFSTYYKGIIEGLLTIMDGHLLQ